MSPKPVEHWAGRTRVDVTASLPDDHPGAPLLRAILLASSAARDGATLSGPHTGIWQGQTETAWTLSRVTSCGDASGWIAAAVSAALRAGCEAVQVERWGADAGSGGYVCEEWRADA